MVSCFVVPSHQPGAATVKNTSALEKGPGSPRSNFPFAPQRMGVAPGPVPEKYARTSGKYSGDEKGTSTDVVGIAAAVEKEIPVATVESK